MKTANTDMGYKSVLRLCSG